MIHCRKPLIYKLHLPSTNCTEPRVSLKHFYLQLAVATDLQEVLITDGNVDGVTSILIVDCITLGWPEGM